MRTSTNKVQPGTLHESDKEDLQVLVLRVSGQLSIRAQETSSIYSVRKLVEVRARQVSHTFAAAKLLGCFSRNG